MEISVENLEEKFKEIENETKEIYSYQIDEDNTIQHDEL